MSAVWNLQLTTCGSNAKQLEAVRVAVEDGAATAESEAAKRAGAKEVAAKVVAETERAMEAWRNAGPGPVASFPITVSSVTGSVEIEVTAQMSVGELQSVIEEKLGAEKERYAVQVCWDEGRQEHARLRKTSPSVTVTVS